MKNFKTHATHYITSSSNFNFSKKDYSKFKFGDSKIGEDYGKDLLESFFKYRLFTLIPLLSSLESIFTIGFSNTS